MALSTEDAAWLVKLKAARQLLLLGQQPASVSSGGRSISFAQIPADKALELIDGEIARLEAGDASPTGKSPKRGLLRFSY